MDAELRRTHYGFTLYPTGLGTAAARLPASSSVSGPVPAAGAVPAPAVSEPVSPS
jgi:hypothetical protein